MVEFLHERRDFDQLLAVVASDRGLDPMLVEKDYWIMHWLWGLQDQGFVFELKGGTSLSKGFTEALSPRQITQCGTDLAL